MKEKKEKTYVIKTTNGNDSVRTEEDMLELCGLYLKKYCNIENPTKKECEEEIEHFITKFKYIEPEKVDEVRSDEEVTEE